MPVFRAVPAAALVALALAVTPAAADAQTTHCKGNHYLLIDTHVSPSVGNIVAVGLPRLTDGYAPRCLVAEAIAGEVQLFRYKHPRYPRSLRIYGAQWDGGVWKLTYATRRAGGKRYEHATATQGAKRVTADFGR